VVRLRLAQRLFVFVANVFVSTIDYLPGREGAEPVPDFMYDKPGVRGDVWQEVSFVITSEYKDGARYVFFNVCDELIQLLLQMLGYGPQKPIMMICNSDLLWNRLIA
jgi:hypothetical protein